MPAPTARSASAVRSARGAAAAPHGASLPHRPGLDGLRGLAVAAVVVYHLGYGWAGGGFLGVSLFFTLSGYLVTSVLLAEHAATGRVSLRSFWARRARRILPASLLVLTGVVLLASRLPTAPGLAGDVRAALGQVANWRFVLSHRSYVAQFGAPSPLKHLWSLAIEEQCYLVLPIVAVLALRRGRRALAATLAGLFVASLAAQLWLRDAPFDRVYQGTDTRAGELLLGALVACVLTPARLARTPERRRSRVGAAVSFGALAVLWGTTRLDQHWLRLGGLGLVAFVHAAVLVVAAGPLGRRVMGWRPLAALGRISYGVYLYHWPLVVWVTAERTGWAWWIVDVVRVGGAVGLAALSYRFVEQPVRRGALPPRLSLRMGGYAFGGVLVATLLLPAAAPAGAAAVLARDRPVALPGTAPVAAGAGSSPSSGAASAGADAGTAASFAAPWDQPFRPSPTIGPSPTFGPRPVVAGVVSTPAAVTTATVAPTTTPTASPPSAPGVTGTTTATTVGRPRPRLWLAGDSVPYSVGPALTLAAAARGADVVNLAIPACDGARGNPTVRIGLGIEDTETRPECLSWDARWPAFAAADPPGVVLFVLGGNVTLDRKIDGVWRTPCQAEFRRWYEPEVLARIDWVLANTTAQPVLTISPWAGDKALGVLQGDHKARTDCVNEVYRAVAAQRPAARLLDLQSFVCPDGEARACEPWRSDGLHYDGQGATEVAGWLADQLLGPAPRAGGATGRT